VFEDLNYEELRRRANECLPDRVVVMEHAEGHGPVRFDLPRSVTRL
jgi:hypothetical protein